MKQRNQKVTFLKANSCGKPIKSFKVKNEFAVVILKIREDLKGTFGCHSEAAKGLMFVILISKRGLQLSL